MENGISIYVDAGFQIAHHVHVHDEIETGFHVYMDTELIVRIDLETGLQFYVDAGFLISIDLKTSIKFPNGLRFRNFSKSGNLHPKILYAGSRNGFLFGNRYRSCSCSEFPKGFSSKTDSRNFKTLFCTPLWAK